ncbi:MAG: roadblock/LC7 family protein [Verrucomicrobiales bacterium]|jgi:predicted regulator of Ras-like GTPase activity (Roadblock/LC7/MglB family)|nr:roadblock/LC7 family protein [Verrucomicrobiales bacterium]
MFSLPQLFGEDIEEFNSALDRLLSQTDALAAMIIDVGGFLITCRGENSAFDATTLAALAAASFSATQQMAITIGESTFNSVYQQGEKFSLLLQDVNGQCLLVVIFKADNSVGALKYCSTDTIERTKSQLGRAQERHPSQGLDLSSLNLADPSAVFKRKQE